MSDQPNLPQESFKPVGSPKVKKTQEEMSLLLQRIVGDDISLTEKQIDEVLSQRTKVHEFIHKERMQRHDRFLRTSSDRKFYFLWAIGLSAVFGLLILFFKEQYFSEFISAVLGFLGGVGVSGLTKKISEE